MQHLFTSLIALICAFSVLAASDLGEADGPLYRTLFSPHLSAPPPRETLPDSLRPHWDRYIAALSALEEPTVPPNDIEAPLQWLREKRHALTRGIIALTGAFAPEAAAFAESCLLCYEWEGMSDCPLAEARCAEEFLKVRPDSPLGPAALLFLAHRYRAAAECLLVEGKEHDAALARQRADDALSEARRAKDPLVAYMADELARAPWVYLEVLVATPEPMP